MIENIIHKLQNKEINLSTYFFTLLTIIIIRTQFEYIIEFPNAITINRSFSYFLVDYFHFVLSWLTIFVNIVLIVNFFTKESFITTAKVSLFLFPIIISVPIIDLILNTQMQIRYQQEFSTFIFNFINTFNFFEKDVSFPYGVRIEVFFIIISSFIYVYKVTQNLYKAILSSFIIYISIFFYAYLPAIYEEIFPGFHIMQKLPFADVTNFFFYMYIPCILIILAAIYFRLTTNYKNTLKHSIRIERLMIYIGIFIIGILSTMKNTSLTQFINPYDILKILTAILSIILAFMYSTILNDIYDVNIDKVTNKKRPLVNQDINLENFQGLKYIVLFLSLIFAMSVNIDFLFLIIFIISLSYVYSSPPFRLRKYFLISNLILACIASFTYLLGTTLLNLNQPINKIDMNLFLVIFILFFIASHLKDIKDIKGDKLSGILTLPVLIGGKKSYILLSLLIIISLAIVSFYLKIALLLSISSIVIFVLSSILAKDSEKLITLLQISVSILAIGYIIQ